jgi:hypothetical protein
MVESQPEYPSDLAAVMLARSDEKILGGKLLKLGGIVFLRKFSTLFD